MIRTIIIIYDKKTMPSPYSIVYVLSHFFSFNRNKENRIYVVPKYKKKRILNKID